MVVRHLWVLCQVLGGWDCQWYCLFVCCWMHAICQVCLFVFMHLSVCVCVRQTLSGKILALCKRIKRWLHAAVADSGHAPAGGHGDVWLSASVAKTTLRETHRQSFPTIDQGYLFPTSLAHHHPPVPKDECRSLDVNSGWREMPKGVNAWGSFFSNVAGQPHKWFCGFWLVVHDNLPITW